MFRSINPKEIDNNAIELIGDQWMILSAGTEKNFNGMIANWGGMGYMWNKPVVFIVVRPTRYTYEFVERQASFSLAFFSDQYKKALSIFGSQSGRDIDKIEASGLTPFFTTMGNPAYREADLILECTKLYAQTMVAEDFIDKSVYDKWYDADALHKTYIAEIKNAMKR